MNGLWRACLWTLAAFAPVGVAALLVLLLDISSLAVTSMLWAVGLAGAVLVLRRPIGDGVALRRSLARLAERDQGLRRTTAAREALIVAALDALPDPVLLLSDARAIVRANAAARALFGDDILARDLAEALRDPAILEAVETALGGAAAAVVDFRLSTPVSRDFTCHVARLDGDMPDDAAVLLAFRDFTEVRRTEQMRADFVANASHEIRTPLATLSGCVETLLGPAKDDSEARGQFLAIMEQQAKRMTRLVEDLLSLSRIELNEHSQPTGSLDIAPVLRRVVDGLAMKAADDGVHIELTVAPETPAVVGDADELEQVFQNLVDNAVKYGAAGALVEIDVSQTRRRLPYSDAEAAAIAVSVRDHGPGIPADALPRLTERFYRIDTARSRELGGTGLGLAIVKHIVSRHRGLLTIESEPGAGATFTVFLPPAAG